MEPLLKPAAPLVGADLSKKIVAIAPMIDITNIFFRYLMRLMSKKCTLYTEMIASTAVLMSKYSLCFIKVDLARSTLCVTILWNTRWLSSWAEAIL